MPNERCGICKKQIDNRVTHTRAVLYQCRAIWRSYWNLIAIGSRRVAFFRVSVGVKIEKWQSQSVVHGSILVGLTQPVPGRHTYPLSRKQALSLLQRGCLTRQFLVSHTMEMTVHVLMLMLTAQRWQPTQLRPGTLCM